MCRYRPFACLAIFEFETDYRICVFVRGLTPFVLPTAFRALTGPRALLSERFDVDAFLFEFYENKLTRRALHNHRGGDEN